jgi:hypothetical protein
MAPLNRGEAITEPGSLQVCVASESGIPVLEPISSWLETLDDDARNAFRNAGVLSDDRRHLVVACLVSDTVPISFEALKALVFARSWLGEPRAPGQLCEARYDVNIGAGRNELTPRQFQQLCSLQRSGVFFSVGKSSDEFEQIPLHLFDTDGSDKRAALHVKDLARSVGVPGEVLYGYEAKSRIRVVAYRVEDRPEVPWNADAVRGNLLHATENSAVLKAELASEFDRCRERVVGRLESRLARSSQRRVLQPRPGYLPGRGSLIEPTNEMETVWLTSRLEPDISVVWPGFKLLDYTPKDGIDAIARCRLGPLGVEQLHPLEVEFNVKSVFGHAHPVHQVAAIICWSAGDISDGPHQTVEFGGAPSSDMSLTISTAGPLRTLNFGAHVVQVLCLDEFCKGLGYERV